jgi:hypothetical protein
MFYPPVVLYCLWLAIKYRGFNVPTVANPGIFTGGIVGESKMDMLKNLSATSPQFTAEAALVKGDTFAARLDSFERQRARLRLTYPFMIKPDVGQRGTGVKLIQNQEQAEAYLRQCAAPVIIQRYAPGPFEAGIFCYRFPHEPRGRIFSITEKVFPVIVGDGMSTVGQLIRNDVRARLIERTYRRRFAARWEEVLPANETLRLVEAGNHAQGCIFRDGMHLNSPQLEARINDISQQLDGFFIGRFDIRYGSESELRVGNNFQIVELNGAAAEAASIYDSRNSLWSAYRTLFHQWELVFAIGAANRDRGHAPIKTRQVWRAWRAYARTALEYPVAD